MIENPALPLPMECLDTVLGLRIDDFRECGAEGFRLLGFTDVSKGLTCAECC